MKQNHADCLTAFVVESLQKIHKIEIMRKI